MNPVAVHLQGIELSWLQLHLRTSHTSSLGVITERPVIVVRLDTDGGQGWGECACLPLPDYSEEYAQGAWSVLCDFLLPMLQEAALKQGKQLPDARSMLDVLAPVRGHAMAKACLEMAVLDSELRFSETSLAERLGVVRDQVEAGAVLGFLEPGDSTGLVDLLVRVADLVTKGYSRVKVKIGPGADFEVLSALRGSFPDLAIQADANGAYRLDDASHRAALESFDDLDLLCIEQPLDPDDLLGHSQLASRLATPVCLDESVSSLGRIREAIALRACDIVCIKPARLGGILQAVAAHEICASEGIPVWCGGMLETALARSANAALAALPGFVLPGDLQGGERFVEPDPFLAGTGARSPSPSSSRPAASPPLVEVYRGPGVGPTPDTHLLDQVTSRRHYLSC